MRKGIGHRSIILELYKYKLLNKQELYNKIKECETEIANYKNKIDEINNLIIHTCVIQYGDHEFEREVESSIYGESYFICKNCGYER